MSGANVSTTQSARGQMAYIPRAPAPVTVAGVAAEGVGREFMFAGEVAAECDDEGRGSQMRIHGEAAAEGGIPRPASD